MSLPRFRLLGPGGRVNETGAVACQEMRSSTLNSSMWLRDSFLNRKSLRCRVSWLHASFSQGLLGPSPRYAPAYHRLSSGFAPQLLESPRTVKPRAKPRAEVRAIFSWNRLPGTSGEVLMSILRASALFGLRSDANCIQLCMFS